MTRDERWLSYGWSFVRAALPAPPAGVLEIGCGRAGGFVPAMLAGGYAATGVDPDAPDGRAFRRAGFEDYDLPRPVDAVVACTSLHHVTDLDVVLDRIAAALKPGGTAVVIEWAGESFDEATARWCFARLPRAAADEEPGWLARHQQEWLASGQPWQQFHTAWRAGAGLHSGEDVLRALDARFARQSCDYGPYCFADLEATSDADEQAAIDAGQIRATGIRYAGTLR